MGSDSKDVSDVQKKLAIDAGRAVLQDAKERVKSAPIPVQVKIIGGVVVVVVAGVAIMALLAKLWMFAIGAAILGGIGLAGYVVLKPKVLAARAAAEEKLLAGRREQEATRAAQQVVDTQRAKAQKLEDDLAALKKKAGA